MPSGIRELGARIALCRVTRLLPNAVARVATIAAPVSDDAGSAKLRLAGGCQLAALFVELPRRPQPPGAAHEHRVQFPGTVPDHLHHPRRVQRALRLADRLVRLTKLGQAVGQVDTGPRPRTRYRGLLRRTGFGAAASL